MRFIILMKNFFIYSKNFTFFQFFWFDKFNFIYYNILALKFNICFADMAQMVEHILGKDEVTGSIPVISSIQTRQLPCFFVIIF